jgi:hypothetical protein
LYRVLTVAQHSQRIFAEAIQVGDLDVWQNRIPRPIWREWSAPRLPADARENWANAAALSACRLMLSVLPRAGSIAIETTAQAHFPALAHHISQ